MKNLMRVLIQKPLDVYKRQMCDLGKPVLSNYLKDTTYPYTAKGDKDYEIGKFKIKTCITDHNNSG